jgi:hypothetical protein
MNKLLGLILIGSVIIGSSSYKGSTTAGITLIGGIIKAEHVDTTKKHKRKDCPVCKGKGWYISGDGIKKVDCGYCEPEDKGSTKVIVHPPVVLEQNCSKGSCKPINER